MRTKKLALSLVLATITLAALFWLLDTPLGILAQEPEEPQGYIGAKIHDKPCELEPTWRDGAWHYPMNPELTPEEEEECRRLIKEMAVERSRVEIAEQFVPGEVLVRFKDHPVNAENALQKARGLGIAAQAAHLRPSWVKFQLDQPPGLEVAAARANTRSAINTILRSGVVEWAEPNYIAHASVITPTWGQQSIGAPQVWPVVSCDPSIGVAVIDTGIVLTHTEFAGSNVYYGWDFINDDPIADDDNGHGTHVASTAAGANVGICRNGTIVAYKALDASGSGTYDNVASGIISATNDSRVKIINLSLGGLNPSSVLENAVNQAQTAGKVVFSASGNGLGEYPEYPARYDGAIPVGAIDWDWRVATWSTRFEGAESRSLVAPGVDVWGADYSCPTCYVAWDGTSMATPHAAGSTALLWSTNLGLTDEQVKDYLLNNTVELGDPQDYGQGALHIGAAVKAATASYNIPPIVAWPIPWPGLTTPGNSVSIMGLLQDLDGTITSASATITTPTETVVIPMAVNAQDLWEGSFLPTALGTYTATVSASDGTNNTQGFGQVAFRVVSNTLPSGWPQYGRLSAGGAYVSYTIAITSATQIYSDHNNLGSNNDESVVIKYGRADVPEAIRIVSGPACPTGNDYGRRWLFDAEQGVYYDYTDPFSETVELSCWDGAAIGMFANTGAMSGQLIALDEGSGRSDSQASRLHSFDPTTGHQYWLTQLNYYGKSFVRLSEDGRRAYTVHGSYDGLWAVDAVTGERLWFFHPDRFTSIDVAPVESNGRLFVRVSGSTAYRGLYALDPVTGQELWHYNPAYGGSDDSAPVVSADGITVYYCDNGISTSTVMNAVWAETGQLRWSTTIGQYGCSSTPAVTPEYIVQYVEDGGDLYLKLLSPFTGEVLESSLVTNFGSERASPAVVGDIVFQPAYDGWIHAYRLPDLNLVWEREVDPYSSSNWQTSVAVGKDNTCPSGKYVVVFVSSVNGYFRAWKFCITEGEELRISKTGPVTAQPEETITYTIKVSNTGNATAYGVRITDTLPTELEGDDLDTTVDIPANAGAIYLITGTVNLGVPAGWITNTACFSHTTGSDCASWPMEIVEPGDIYLPIILKNY